MGFQVETDAKSQSQNLVKKAKEFYEPQLRLLGLSLSQIEGQSLVELEQSLERVNDCIRNPDSFGIFKIESKVTISLVGATTNGSFQVGVLPTLLEIKKVIIERIKFLKGEEKVENLRDLIKNIDNDSLRSKLESEIDELESDSKRLQIETNEVNEAQIQAQIKAQSELSRLRMELFERRSKVWLSFLERESVATIVGAFLLTIITFTHIVAIFTKVPTSDILNNSFLVILGYFFGQSVARANNDKSDK